MLELFPLLLVLAAGENLPESPSTQVRVSPDFLKPTVEGFQTSIQGDFAIRVHTYIYELTKPGEISFWVNIKNLRRTVPDEKVAFLHIGEGHWVQENASPASEPIYYFSIPEDSLRQSRFVFQCSEPGENTHRKYLFYLSDFVGSTPPPVNLDAITFATSYFTSETDSAYSVKLMCRVSNDGADGLSMCGGFSARGVYRPSQETVSAYVARSDSLERRALEHGWISCFPISPWEHIRCEVTGPKWDDCKELHFDAGGTYSDTLMLTLVKRHVEEWDGGEMVVTVEFTAHLATGEPEEPRWKSKVQVLRIPLLD